MLNIPQSVAEMADFPEKERRCWARNVVDNDYIVSVIGGELGFNNTVWIFTQKIIPETPHFMILSVSNYF